MKPLSLWLLLASLLAPLGRAQTVIPLWPEGIPGDKAGVPAETHENELIRHVHEPSLTVYAPPEGKANGTAVVVSPGGGYYVLAWEKEGVEIAQWLNSLGITAFVLKYRLADYGHPAPLRDITRAIRTVRTKATDYGVKPDHIGALGFSAGGHLTACAGTYYDSPDAQTGAAIDAVSARPDFLVLIYPVISLKSPFGHLGSGRGLFGENPTEEQLNSLAPASHVNANTPPTFLLASSEDTVVLSENSVSFYQALRRAGVQAELHVFQKGPHGHGMRPGNGPVDDWPQLCADWLQLNGWTK